MVSSLVIPAHMRQHLGSWRAAGCCWVLGAVVRAMMVPQCKIHGLMLLHRHSTHHWGSSSGSSTWQLTWQLHLQHGRLPGYRGHCFGCKTL